MNPQDIKNVQYWFQYAYETAETDPLVHFCCKQIKDDIVKVHENKIGTLEERIESIKLELCNKIKIYLMTYNRQEIYIGLMYFKQLFRSKSSDTNYEKNDFEYSLRQEEILHLLLIAQTSTSIKNNSILNGSKNMAFSFRLAYYYSVLIDNIKQYSSCKEEFNQKLKKDIGYIFEEGGFYSKQYANYMDDFLLMNLYEMPEDSQIQTRKIN